MRLPVSSSLGLAWRLARRELRGGIRGFGVMLACLALGVAAIAGAGSLKDGLDAAIRQDARALLGGDLALRLTHIPASADQRAALADQGDLAETIEMRAMARASGKTALVELKAVTPAYPLYGSVATTPDAPLPALLAERGGIWGAAAEPALLTRLGLAVGDIIAVGDARLELRAVLSREPDRVASFFSLGPRLMVDARALPATGLVQPGSLIRYGYLLRLPPGAEASATVDALTQRFPEAGWQIRTTEEAAPGVGRFLDNLTLFLTLVGLTALLIGGVGVANAVKAFVDGRVPTIAILKCVGAASPLVLRLYALQVGLIAGAGILIGLAVGAALPPLVAWTAADRLPLRLEAALYPGPLLLAAGFGVLVALAFGLWPLSRAAAIPPTALFRDVIVPAAAPWRHRGPRRRAVMVAGLAVLVLALLTVLSAENRGLAAGYVIGAGLTLAAFRAAAEGVRRLARRLGGARLPLGTPARLGLARLHQPGAATASVVVSLGVGLTVLVAMALVEANLSRQITETLPEQAPAFFFIDIQQGQAESFDRVVAAVPGVGAVKRAAMLRGRVTRIKGVPVEQAEVAADAQWAVRGDRGITVAATPPEGARITAGAWWPADYQGPPLVSLETRIAQGFGLELGDTVTVNVLGRDLTLTVASLREVQWSSANMNFVFVLSPGALAGAPHAWIATAEATPAAEDALERAVVDALPNVSAIRVRQAIDSVREMLEGIGLAVRLAGSLTVVSGALVLAGAVAAGRRRRIYEAVLLKTIGATRRDLLRAYLVEYGALGLATGVVAGIVGSVAAWAVLVLVMRAEWVFLPATAVLTVVVCTAVALALGFLGTWRVLGLKAAPHLRNE